MMRSMAHTITQPKPSPRFPLKTTTGTNDVMGTTSQGRLSTLSSMVRPTPTTVTRTVAITWEYSRLDALVTVQQMIGPTTAMSQEMGSSMGNHEIQSTSETDIRLPSSPSVSRRTGTTASVGMAIPIALDLIWPGNPDIQGTSLFPRDDNPSTVAVGGLDPEERWKIHHPYDIPRVRRLTMDIPDNLRRLTESEALVESLQTMEFLTEFPP